LGIPTRLFGKHFLFLGRFFHGIQQMQDPKVREFMRLAVAAEAHCPDHFPAHQDGEPLLIKEVRAHRRKSYVPLSASGSVRIILEKDADGNGLVRAVEYPQEA
jgi:hypothetical protein